MLLLWFIVIPFIFGFFCWQSGFFNRKIPKWIALLSTGLMLILALKIMLTFGARTNNDLNQIQWKYEFFLPWISRFNINFHLGVDNLSLLMIFLASILGFISVLCSWTEIKKQQGLFYLNLMLILGSLMGIFLALDMFLFFFFWEIMLVPMYFLISLWGNKSSNINFKINAATKFFIYMQTSSLIMLVSILGLSLAYYQIHHIWTFDYNLLIKEKIPYNVEYLLMLGFFIAFATKMPLIPLHGWLPDTHSQAPTSGSIELAGIVLKTSIYGLLRFNLSLFPNASRAFAPVVMLIGIISIFYGAWMACSQNNIKRLVAYSSISHMGFIVIAIYSGTLLSLQGAMIQIISQSISTSALLILCGQLYERLYTKNISQMGGLWSQIKWFPGFMLFFSAANLGLPGTGNFIGEFMIFVGSFSYHPKIIIFSTFGIIFSSIYSLNMIHKIFYGNKQLITPIKKITVREFSVIISLVILTIFFGLYPQPILDFLHENITNIQKKFILPLNGV